MTSYLLCVASLLAADPSPEAVGLLKQFRDEFVAIKPGEGKFPASFTMGRKDGAANEQPTREVKMTQSFHVAKYEVPQNLWQAVMGSNPSKWKGKRNSVEMLSFDEAKEFCQKATLLMRSLKLIETDMEIRLPTEAEWEYVARAGTSTVYSFGDSVEKLGEFAWYTKNAAGNDPPVGAKKPNAWGLFDIHGYLWEWCLDSEHDNYDGAPNDERPWVDAKAPKRIVRSGSWKDDESKLTSSYRRAIDRDTRDDAVGLRCVLAKVVEK